MPPAPAAPEAQTYTAVAHHALKSYSGMHKEGLPQKLGFRGSFVVGLVIYGNMTRPLVERYGEEWLGHAVVELKLLKPVCDGDRLRIEARPLPGREAERGMEVVAFNETVEGQPAARLETWMPAVLPPVEPHAGLAPAAWEGERLERTWETLVPEQPFRTYRTVPTLDTNRQWTAVIDHALPCYGEGPTPPLHPIQIMRFVQEASNHQFVPGAGVHSGSRAVVRRVLRVGDPLEVLTVPVDKWEKKGNQWTTLYSAVRRAGEVCAEVFHTQIFKLRGA